jgi:hypothetical protein
MEARMCIVCHRPVTPAEGVAFGAFGRELFHAHKDPCAGVVRREVKRISLAAGKSARRAIEARVPGLLKLLKTTFGRAA